MSGLYTPDIELIRERLVRLTDKRGAQGRPLSLKQIGMGIDYSPGTISNFVHRKDLGNVKEIADRLRTYLEREEAKDLAGLLAIPFAETRQAKQVLSAIGFAQRYSRIVAIIGPPGAGKTCAIREALHRDKTAILFQASCIMGPSGVLQELCHALGEPETGTLRGLHKRIRARLEGSGRCVIIDDAHTLSFKALDVLRTIYDQTGIGMVLVGIRALRRLLTGTSEEYEQIASRVSGRIFELPEIDDTDRALILHEVIHADDLDAVMDVITADPLLGGSARRVCNVLEIAGKFAEKAGGKIRLKHLKDAMKVAA